MKAYNNYINGSWVGSEKSIAIHSPINQEKLDLANPS